MCKRSTAIRMVGNYPFDRAARARRLSRFAAVSDASSVLLYSWSKARRGCYQCQCVPSVPFDQAAVDFSEREYLRVAERNLNFVLESRTRTAPGTTPHEGDRDFIDHFHTCFVLKALAKIESLTGDRECTQAIERGVRVLHRIICLTNKTLPKPFSRRPRLTVYRHELYDYAECINLAVLLRGRFPDLDEILSACDQNGRLAKERWVVPSRQLLARMGQYPDASLGSVTDVSESLSSASDKEIGIRSVESAEQGD